MSNCTFNLFFFFLSISITSSIYPVTAVEKNVRINGFLRASSLQALDLFPSYVCTVCMVCIASMIDACNPTRGKWNIFRTESETGKV